RDIKPPFPLRWFFFFQAEDGIRRLYVTGVQTCALPISMRSPSGVKRVVICVASEPASGSVMHSAPIAPSATRGSKRFFCSSVPRSEERRVGQESGCRFMPEYAENVAIGRTDAMACGASV